MTPEGWGLDLASPAPRSVCVYDQEGCWGRWAGWQVAMDGRLRTEIGEMIVVSAADSAHPAQRHTAWLWPSEVPQ